MNELYMYLSTAAVWYAAASDNSIIMVSIITLCSKLKRTNKPPSICSVGSDDVDSGVKDSSKQRFDYIYISRVHFSHAVSCLSTKSFCN